MATKMRPGFAGIDVGATGIKGGLVDIENGRLIGERVKVLTPQPPTPATVADAIAEVCRNLKLKKGATVGLGFPSIIVKGVTKSAANIDKKWIDLNAQRYLSKRTGYQMQLVNDADAAGIAELKFGRAKEQDGTVILLTLGTGIGSALFINGLLVPNTELGHLKFRDGIAEDYASNRARKDHQLTYKFWGKELNSVLNHIYLLFSPDLIILGGGVSKRFSQFKDYLDVECPVVPAKLRNNAGIVGSALFAHASMSSPK
jgi:polyphosphate glucokinase